MQEELNQLKKKKEIWGLVPRPEDQYVMELDRSVEINLCKWQNRKK